jgi:putative redox protein
MKMEIQHSGGWRFDAKYRSHEVVSDQPREEDGEDTGMTPVELFIASLGFCLGVYAKNFCDRHNIKTDNLKIELEWKMAEKPTRIGKIDAEIHVGSNLAPNLAKAIKRVVEHCTIHNTMMNTPKIAISISEP